MVITAQWLPWTRLIFNGIQWTKFRSLEIHLNWGGGRSRSVTFHSSIECILIFSFSIMILFSILVRRYYLSKESGRERLLLLLPALSQDSVFSLDLGNEQLIMRNDTYNHYSHLDLLYEASCVFWYSLALRPNGDLIWCREFQVYHPGITRESLWRLGMYLRW